MGAASLAVALAHGDAGQALLLLRAATRRLGLVEQRPILDACTSLLAKPDPELHSKWARASARREPRSVVTLINEETVVSRLNDAPLRAEGASAPFA